MTFNNLFICYDGENSGTNYFLLGNSKEHIYNKKGLTFSECFNFLTRSEKKKRIIFNLHYDLQFWIKDLKDEKILSLMNGERIKHRNFELQYFSKKMLIIKKGNNLFKIYDILSFFKSSLLGIIEKLEINLTAAEKNILYKGKSNRSDFSKMTKEEIIYYNKTECEVSEKIAGKIYALMLNSFYKDKKNKTKNLVIQNFFGASAIASKLLRDYKINELNKFEKYQNIFEASYYGGRFEVLKLGTFKNVYKYDINSAYPSIIKDLREVKRFIEIKKVKKLDDFGIYNIYYKQFFPNDFICPFPLRHKTGRIFYTGEISGYYFGCEIKSFLESEINPENYELKIFSGIVPVFGKKIFKNNKGYNLIEDLFEQRNIFKQKKDLRHYIYKITLNSLYGKFAQKVGSKAFTNFYYASLITAKTRAILFSESYKIDFSKVICYATDSIISKVPLKVKTGQNLGEWDFEYIKEAEILMSGFYRLKQKNNKYYYGLRGFHVSGEKFDKIINEIKKKGKSSIKLNQFISHKLAIKNKEAYLKKRLLFTPLKKIIDIKNGNFKRSYNFKDNFNADKSNFHIFNQIKSVNQDKKELYFSDIFIDY